jgi:hypothetical protein
MPDQSDGREIEAADPAPAVHGSKPAPTANDSQPPGPQASSWDWQPMIVAGTGLVIVGLIVLIGVSALPGSVPRGQVNTAGQNIVSIATAAITAVAAVVGAYFGVKSANSAREDTVNALQKARADAQDVARRHDILMSTIAGRLPGDQAKEALQAADERLKASGLL